MKKALLVGINAYRKSPLYGCVSDANKMQQILACHGDNRPNFSCKLLTSENHPCVSRSTLMDHLKELLTSQVDEALFYFSGHGSRNILGGFLIPQDAQSSYDGLSFRDLNTLLLRSPIKVITVILDCCHAGSMGDDDLAGLPVADLREGVTIMAATRAADNAIEQLNGGIFTSLLIDALNGEAADIMGNITLAGVYSYVDSLLSAWEQRPIYKIYASHLSPLRVVAPKIEIGKIRQLATLFPTIDHEVRLSPAYVPSAGLSNTELQLIFRDLQAMRAVNLVEPAEPEIHLYYAAMNEGRCRLTPQGRFYWRMVSRGIL